jgi:hypothetical protein
MAIEKSLYALPTGLPEEGIEVDIEIEQVDDEEPVVEIEIGGSSFDANLADEMPEADLQEIADDILDMIRIDKNSRKDWERTYVEGLELLGLKLEDRTEPWEGACGVYHPILSESVVKFQSETIIETFPPKRSCKDQDHRQDHEGKRGRRRPCQRGHELRTDGEDGRVPLRA